MAKIGIDFGTTNTVISHYQDDEPDVFHYPGNHSSPYIPSVVCVTRKGEFLVGYEAMGEAGDPSNIFYKAMKMYLPLNDGELRKLDWPVRSEGEQLLPEDVIQRYFTKLLKKGEMNSFETTEEEIQEIVLCVPHVWNREITHKGREKLKEIFDGLGFKLARLVSEPIAAAAHFLTLYQKKFHNRFVGNLLVCDLGGGTFDVTLCKVHDSGKVEELLNDGHGMSSLGLGLAGVCFDHNLIKKAYFRKYKREIEIDGTEFRELYSMLQEKKNTSSERINSNLEIMSKDKEADRNDSPVISPIQGIGFYYDDIVDSFEPIKKGMLEVLGRLEAKRKELSLGIDALFLTGGFNQFFLCKKTIDEFFADDNSQTVIDAALDTNIAGLSISSGACMIANGIVSIDEKFPHSIGFVAYSGMIEAGKEMKKIYVPLIKGGKQLQDYDKYTLSPDEFLITLDSNRKLKFEFYIDLYGDKQNRRDFKFSDFELPGNPRIGTKWKIGMRIDLSQIVYVLFENTEGKRHEKKLLDIMERLGQGKIFLSDSGKASNG